ncbi:hypothetical protein HVA01_06740 [Halovibrio variabilis]|uniref:Uncharacterized protein n=1 Tax=Halovibrio variabilis TaxID=31910 RepID=A0A511UMY4_9GAMM|nr:hypothetical protein [Halovibrio variabilis]GEN27028.1 hypothetical protein HVA01_06740 [Halovibrio variabilis]
MLKCSDGTNLYHPPMADAAGLNEAGIQPLNQALAEVGAQPLASGGGQTYPKYRGLLGKIFSGNAKVPYRPYATFSASEAFARWFQRFYDTSSAKFYYRWSIEGPVRSQGYSLVWTIAPSDNRLAKGDVEAAFMKNDIRALATVVRQASVNITVSTTPG